MALYKIVRMYRDATTRRRTTVATHKTLEEAQAHCKDPETSSSTCKLAKNIRRTRMYGPWFDGYEEM